MLKVLGDVKVFRKNYLQKNNSYSCYRGTQVYIKERSSSVPPRTKKGSNFQSQLRPNALIFSFRFTPLHHAALLGDLEVISSIIEMGGDVNTRDKKGIDFTFFLVPLLLL